MRWTGTGQPQSTQGAAKRWYVSSKTRLAHKAIPAGSHNAPGPPVQSDGSRQEGAAGMAGTRGTWAERVSPVSATPGRREPVRNVTLPRPRSGTVPRP